MPNPLVWPRAYVVQDQVQAWQCWASVLEAVCAFYMGPAYKIATTRRTPASLQEVYAAAGGAAKNPGAASDLKKAMELTGHYQASQKAPTQDNGRKQFQPSDKNFSLVKREIDAGRPIVCSFRYHQKPVRHVVLVYGYVDGKTPQVYVADPAPGVTRKPLWSFDDFCNNYREMAHWCEVGLTQENDWANLGSLFD